MKILIVMIFGISVCATAMAQESPAEIAADLQVAVDSYQKGVEEAAADVDQLLEDRREYAKRRGDLELLKTVEAERESFAVDRTLPKSVRTTKYQAAVKRLQMKLQSSYQDAIKAYLQADLTDDAFAAQKELSTFLSEPVKKRNNEWISLFDGNDISAWKVAGGQSGKWSVENGILVGRSTETSSVLVTENDGFENFHLRVETMLSQGQNAALNLRWTGEGGGLKVEIGGSRPGEYRKTGDVRLSHGIRKGDVLLIDAPMASIEKGQWFTMEVVCDQKQLEILIDQKTLVKLEQISWVQPGSIGLTCRGRSAVRFRKVELKPLGDQQASSE